MAHNYLSSPSRTEIDLSRTRDFELSPAEKSFYPPEGRDGLFSTKFNNAAQTPRNRNNIAQLKNANAQNEFTPLMKSAVANRTRQVNGFANGKLATPAGLKADYHNEMTPGLPEASTFDAQSSFSEVTQVPHQSSSIMSTPVALPRRGEGEIDGQNGNVLTLREQEAVSSLHLDCAQPKANQLTRHFSASSK